MNKFSIRKVLQILFYIQNSPLATSSAKDSIMYFLKIIFFADRYHLRNYGITVSYDSYYAMKNGPVASAVYEILQKKQPSNLNTPANSFLDDITQTSEYTVKIEKQQCDELSKSDIEALDFSLKEYGKFDQFQLSDMTHDYPEWEKHEKELNENDSKDSKKRKRINMSFKDFFDNPRDLKYSKRHGKELYPFCEDEEFLADMKEFYLNDKNAICSSITYTDTEKKLYTI